MNMLYSQQKGSLKLSYDDLLTYTGVNCAVNNALLANEDACTKTGPSNRSLKAKAHHFRRST